MPYSDPAVKRDYDRQWRERNRERTRESARRYRAEHPEMFREAGRRYRAKRGPQRANTDYNRAYRLKTQHGMTYADWDAMWDSQQGRCYLCGAELVRDRRLTGIDHDHRCCPDNRSCAACRRGLVHRSCNVIAGLADDDPDLLVRIATNLRSRMLPRQSVRPVASLLSNGVMPTLTGDSAEV
jgi:Recombination endonuclease VII